MSSWPDKMPHSAAFMNNFCNKIKVYSCIRFQSKGFIGTGWKSVDATIGLLPVIPSLTVATQHKPYLKSSLPKSHCDQGLTELSMMTVFWIIGNTSVTLLDSDPVMADFVASIYMHLADILSYFFLCSPLEALLHVQ
jgi:hypothetical protein